MKRGPLRDDRERWAKTRREVILPDGRTGRIQFIGRNSDRAKVLVMNRYVMVPVEDLTVISTHLIPVAGTSVMPCCGCRVAVLGPKDRLTSDAARVTCVPYWKATRV